MIVRIIAVSGRLPRPPPPPTSTKAVASFVQVVRNITRNTRRNHELSSRPSVLLTSRWQQRNLFVPSNIRITSRLLPPLAMTSGNETCFKLLISSFSTSCIKSSSSSNIDFSHQQNLHQQERHYPKSRLPTNFLSTIQKQHPKLKISTNPYDLDSHGHGESYHPSSPPDAVLYPSSEDQIMDILRLCCKEVVAVAANNGGMSGGSGSIIDKEEEKVTTVEIVSVIPFGAGTSLEGHLSFLLPPDSNKSDGGSGGVSNDIVEIPSSLFFTHSNNDYDRNNDDGGNNYSNKFKKVRIRRKGGIMTGTMLRSLGSSLLACLLRVASRDLAMLP